MTFDADDSDKLKEISKTLKEMLTEVRKVREEFESIKKLVF